MMTIPAIYLGEMRDSSFGARYRPPNEQHVGSFLTELVKTFATEEEAKDFVHKYNSRVGLSQPSRDSFVRGAA